MLAVNGSKGVKPEMNLRECSRCVSAKMRICSYSPGFETKRRRHKNTNTEVSETPKKRIFLSA